MCLFLILKPETDTMNSMTTMQKYAEVASINGNTLKSMYDLTLTASEAVFSLNTGFSRSVAECVAAPAGSLDVTAQIGLQAAQLERTSVYLRDLCDIVTRTQTEVFKVGTLGAEEAAKLAKAELDELISAWPVANLKFLDVRGLVAR